MKFIKDCLDSIFQQTILTKSDYEIKLAVNVVDNGSQDGTVEFVRNNYPWVHVLKNINNLGFSRGHNQAIRMSETDWVLLLNVDVILEPDFLERLLAVAKSCQAEVAGLSGKLLKITTLMEEGGLTKIIKTDKIDSYGLLVKKNRQVKNIGEGEVDRGQYDEMKQVFGFSGACVLYKREALEDIKFRDEYLDEDFFAYQEDFDLSYRLQLFGWEAVFVPGARAYHFRSAPASQGHLSILKSRKIRQARKLRTQITNYHSYKNHLFVLLKNEIGENFWRHFIFIFWYELKKLIFLLFFEPKTFLSLRQFLKLAPRMWMKRKIIMSRRKVTAEYIRSIMSS